MIDETISCCRYVWNGFLALKEFKYKNFQKKLSYSEMCNLLTQIKKTDTFLKQVDSTALQQTLKKLDNTYKMFFMGYCKYPKFKSKKISKNSYKSTTVKIKGNQILIPKVGMVYSNFSREIKGVITSAVISKTSTNKYFISFTVKEEFEELPKVKKIVGIDLGLKSFAYLSDGTSIKTPKSIWKYAKRIKRLQKKLYKKKNNKSQRYYNLKLYIATLQERIDNIRNDFLHKLSTKLIRENQSIYLEDLNIRSMLKCKKLVMAIEYSGFNTFIKMLKLKSKMYGRTVVQINQNFPSSKICSKCGNLKLDLKFNDRFYNCDCGLIIDRDYNAAINILSEGKKLEDRTILMSLENLEK